MKCKNCGFDNMDGANFCIQCGTRLEKEEPEQSEDVTISQTSSLPEESAPVQQDEEVSVVQGVQEADVLQASYEEPVVEAEEVIEVEPEPEPAPAVKWYYVKNKASQGPVDQPVLENMIATSKLLPDSYIWTPGMADWAKVKDTQFAILVPVQKAAPQPEPVKPVQDVLYYQEPEPEPQQTAAQAEQWFYVQNSSSSGPFNLEVMNQLIQSGVIGPDTYVWKEGMTDWALLRNTSLASLLKTQNTGPAPTWQSNTNQNYSATGIVKERSIFLNIVLSIVTCGIWYFVWMFTLARDIDLLSAQQNKPKGADPILTIILTLLTCNLFEIYFFYRDGKVLGNLEYSNYHPQDQAVLLAVLGLFLPIVSMAIMQDQVNTIVKYGN